VRPYARAELICEADTVGHVIRRLEEADAERLLELRLRNRAFMAPFDPDRPEDFYSLDRQRFLYIKDGGTS
jgi:hypothetical protein